MRRKAKRVRFPKYVSAQTFHDVHCSAIRCDRCFYAAWDFGTLDGCELCQFWVAGIFDFKYFNDADRRRYAAMIRKAARPSKG